MGYAFQGQDQTLERPICPYPQEAVYNGVGDIMLASSFQCGTAFNRIRADAIDVDRQPVYKPSTSTGGNTESDKYHVTGPLQSCRYSRRRGLFNSAEPLSTR